MNFLSSLQKNKAFSCKKALLFAISIFFLFGPLISAKAIQNIFISEIAWMGDKDSFNNEWIELYNNSGLEVNLKGWTLKTEDESVVIKLEGIIKPKGFYLLKRGSFNIGDQKYTGSLENKGEKIEIYDNLNILIESLDCSQKWFKGNNTTKQTMERSDFNVSANNPENWKDSELPGGTPKTENSKKEALESTSSEKPEESLPETSPTSTLSKQPDQNNVSIYLIPLITSLFSGLMVLSLKHSIKRK